METPQLVELDLSEIVAEVKASKADVTAAIDKHIAKITAIRTKLVNSRNPKYSAVVHTIDAMLAKQERPN